MQAIGLFLLLAAAFVLGMSEPASASAGDGALCHAATRQAEHDSGVPDQLLTAISRVESGRTDPVTGRAEAWPWSINVEGVGHVYDSREEATAAVIRYQAQGIRSIDVGCMQINLRQHPEAFTSLAEAFDPAMNAAFAASFLVRLFHQTGSWPHAAAAYHSETPELGRDYQNQVLAKWAEGDDPVTADARGPHSGHATVRVAAAEGAKVPAIFAAQPTPGVSPFGSLRASFRTNYGPQASVIPPGSGRGLSAYRLMPVALAFGRTPPSRF